jgi:phosphoserine phosphatase
MLISSCKKDDTEYKNLILNTEKLDKLNWSDRNYQVISQLIKDYGIGGKFNDPQKPPYIILDWDQTCSHFDVEEAVMRYQLTNLHFKITKKQFRELLKDEINEIKQLSSENKKIVLKDINNDLINDYNYLYDNYLGLSGKKTLEEIKKSPQYNDLLAKLPYIYEGYCETKGIGAVYGYPWVISLLAGFTVNEVKILAKDAIFFELANKLSKEVWTSPANYPTKSGIISCSFKSGLRVLPEMQNLISTFEANGIDVFIVSASYKPIVEVFSGIGMFGYNVPPDRVIGMELEIADDGKILPEYKYGWFKTQRQGKIDAINKVIKQGLGKNWDPVFSACDSDGDYEMCTMFPDMKLTLIWNRVKGGDIGKLCLKAVEEKDSSTPRYILQGRNENTGVAIPCSETILFGSNELTLLK